MTPFFNRDGSINWPSNIFDLLRYLDWENLSQDHGLMEKLVPFAHELKRRFLHPSINYRPAAHPRRDQASFHRSLAMVRVLFGGNQSGKSKAAAHEIYWWVTGTHPHQSTVAAPRVYVISTHYRTLQEGVWRHLRDIIPEWSLVKQGPNALGWNVPLWVQVRHAGGGVSQIDFITASGGKDAREKLQAAAIDLISIDEEVDQAVWQELQARRLARGGRAMITATAILSDPWILDLEDRSMQGDKDVEVWHLDTLEAVQAGHVSKAVYDEMAATLSPEDQLVRLRGHTRREAGLVYQDFGPIHTVEPFEIPKDWTRYMAIDPGIRTCAVLWVAVSPDRHFYGYRELYLHGEKYYDVVSAICQAEGWDRMMDAAGSGKPPYVMTTQSERITCRYIDPAAFGRHETGEPKIGHILLDYGLECLPAMNDVEYGIERVRRALMLGMDGVPQFRVFRSCRFFLREAKLYRRREAQVTTRNQAERSDSPVRKDNHLMDCWRYLMVSPLEHVPDRGTKGPKPMIPVAFSTTMQARAESHWNRIESDIRREKRWRHWRDRRRR